MQQENVEITSSKCAFAVSFAGSFLCFNNAYAHHSQSNMN